jgi:hypothetical protein
MVQQLGYYEKTTLVYLCHHKQLPFFYADRSCSRPLSGTSGFDH